MVCESNTGYAKHRDAGKKVAAFDNLVMHVPTAWACEIFLDACTDWACETIVACADRVCESLYRTRNT